MMNYDNFDAILFDMDGTIFDSETVHRQAWKITAKQYDQEFTDEMYLNFIGMTTPSCMEVAGTWFNSSNGTKNTVDMQLFSESYYQNLHELHQQAVPLKAGFLEYLRFLKTLNKPLGIVTSSARPGVTANFMHYDFYDAFNVVISRDEVSQYKPHPAPYLLACEKLQVDPQRALVFEDSNAGATAALDAGCYVIGIPDLVAFNDEVKSRLYKELGSFGELL
ncbi:HAD family hydrolase [Colwellia echini]|uniref:HAD family phosphatase n=1 Tax=Colwellia echini TaxID=1982103 RepID=A0ABY3MVE4_9GAMM|nr:HAD family phosphatase [Colwellia echini]TYK65164.1 HAD family phosphatase [Colwellia echini]